MTSLYYLFRFGQHKKSAAVINFKIGNNDLLVKLTPPSTKAASIFGIVPINWIELLLLYRNGSGLINTIPSIAIVLLTYQLQYLTSAATSCNTNDQF